MTTENSNSPQTKETIQETFRYTPIDRSLDPIDMHVHRGDQVVLLTPVSDAGRYDLTVLEDIVETLDGAWNFYADVTGQEPIKWDGRHIDGLGTIAVVPKTCGAGCGYLGFTGIEIINRPFFDQWLHDSVASNNMYDQILFYELGRNFWFYGQQLDSIPVTTGFAIANRFLSMDALGLEGAPFNNHLPFDEFKSSIMDDLSQLYFDDDSLNWSNTILTGSAPNNPYGWGGADFFASLAGRVYEDFGNEVYADFWQNIGRGATTNDPDVATQIIIDAASDASGIDYSFLLKQNDEIFVVGDRENNKLTLPDATSGEIIIAHGFAGDDKINGGTGNDLIFGGSGNDKIDGHSGDDILVGSSGNDIIESGLGDDLVYGGPGQDTAVFDGMINDFDGLTFDGDLSYVVTDTNPADGDGGRDRLDGVEIFEFRNAQFDATTGEITPKGSDGLRYVPVSMIPEHEILGTDGDNWLHGSRDAEYFDAGAGSDRVLGNAGDDAFLMGDGRDFIGGGGGSDTALFDGLIDDFDGLIFDGDLTYFVTDTNPADGDSGRDRLGGVEIFEFKDALFDATTGEITPKADGTLSYEPVTVIPGREGFGTADSNRLVGGKAAEYFDAGAGSDGEIGKGGDDVFLMGEGRDFIGGGGGNDTAIFDGMIEDFAGLIFDGDLTYFVTDTNPADGDSGRDRLGGVETFVFKDAVFDATTGDITFKPEAPALDVSLLVSEIDLPVS